MEVVEDRHVIWVEAHIGPGWRAVGRFVTQNDGALVLAEVRVYPYEPPDVGATADEPDDLLYLDRYDTGKWSADPAAVPPGGLTTRLLRDAFGVEAMYDAARRVAHDPPGSLIEEWAPRSAFEEAKTRSGPERTDDVEYALWAKRYEEAYGINPRSPYKVLTEDDKQRGGGGIRKTIGGHVQEARRRRFLTSLSKGRAGGQLTPAGRQVLVAAGIDPDRKD